MDDWPGMDGRASPRIAPLCRKGEGCKRPWELQSGSARDRFWGARLARAAVATSNADSWRPLLAKLRAGRPITVVGIGALGGRRAWCTEGPICRRALNIYPGTAS